EWRRFSRCESREEIQTRFGSQPDFQENYIRRPRLDSAFRALQAIRLGDRIAFSLQGPLHAVTRGGFVIDDKDNRLHRLTQSIIIRDLFLAFFGWFRSFICPKSGGVVLFKGIEFARIQVVFPLCNQSLLLPILITKRNLPAPFFFAGDRLFLGCFPSNGCNVVRALVLSVVVNNLPKRLCRVLLIHLGLHREDLLDDLFALGRCLGNSFLYCRNLWIFLGLRRRWTGLVVTSHGQQKNCHNSNNPRHRFLSLLCDYISLMLIIVLSEFEYLGRYCR